MLCTLRAYYFVIITKSDKRQKHTMPTLKQIDQNCIHKILFEVKDYSFLFQLLSIEPFARSINSHINQNESIIFESIISMHKGEHLEDGPNIKIFERDGGW